MLQFSEVKMVFLTFETIQTFKHGVQTPLGSRTHLVGVLKLPSHELLEFRDQRRTGTLKRLVFDQDCHHILISFAAV